MKRIAVICLVILVLSLFSGCCLSHEWKDATCEAAKTCIKCGETEGESLPHSWMVAVCDAPQTCEKCGATQGIALGHAWVEATWEKSKICSACLTTEGTPLNFFDSNGLTLENVVLTPGIQADPLETMGMIFVSNQISFQEPAPVTVNFMGFTSSEPLTEGVQEGCLMIEPHIEVVNTQEKPYTSMRYEVYLFDYYSGEMLVVNDLLEFETSTLESKGQTWEYCIRSDTEWIIGEGEARGNAMVYPCFNVRNYLLSLPEDYDGLVLALPRLKAYDPEDPVRELIYEGTPTAAMFQQCSNLYEDVTFYRIDMG